MPDPLSAFAGKHAGAVAWLIGAGPSLAAFLAARPFLPAEDLVIGVNEVPIVLAAHGIPCDYGAAADPCDHYAHALPPGLPIFLAPEAIANARAPLPAGPVIPMPVGSYRGTVILAGKALQHMGVRHLICVGLDGGPARADLPWLSPPTLDPRSYSIIRDLFLTWADRAGMPVTLWGTAGSITPYPPDKHSLAPYLDAHPGATGFIIGKGPSLDAFLAGAHPVASQPSPPVLAFLSDTLAHERAITAAVAALSPGRDPVPVYAFANDAITRWVDLYRPGHTLFQPRRTVNNPSMAAPPPNCQRVLFEDTGSDHGRLGLPPAQLLARGLVAQHGTCESAAQILKIMGCTRLVAVGCDGTPGRSALPWRTEMRDDHAADYADIRRDFERILLGLDLPTEFYGEPRILRRLPRLRQPGAIRLTRATVFRGQGHDAGAEFADCTAAEIQTLIGCGKAEPVFLADPAPAGATT